MSEKPENPSAFPIVINETSEEVHFGMTLRDYFAAAALTGLLANKMYSIRDEDGYTELRVEYYEDEDGKGKHFIPAVSRAFEAADAMIKERARSDD